MSGCKIASFFCPENHHHVTTAIINGKIVAQGVSKSYHESWVAVTNQLMIRLERCLTVFDEVTLQQANTVRQPE